MKKEFLQLLDLNEWTILLLHIPLFVCAWMGCWIATMGTRRPSKFVRTLARGILGGAVGGLFSPWIFLSFAAGLTVQGKQGRVSVLEALLPVLAEGAVLCLPLAIKIAVRKRREPDPA